MCLPVLYTYIYIIGLLFVYIHEKQPNNMKKTTPHLLLPRLSRRVRLYKNPPFDFAALIYYSYSFLLNHYYSGLARKSRKTDFLNFSCFYDTFCIPPLPRGVLLTFPPPPMTPFAILKKKNLTYIIYYLIIIYGVIS